MSDPTIEPFLEARYIASGLDLCLINPSHSERLLVLDAAGDGPGWIVCGKGDAPAVGRYDVTHVNLVGSGLYFPPAARSLAGRLNYGGERLLVLVPGMNHINGQIAVLPGWWVALRVIDKGVAIWKERPLPY